MRWKYRRQLWSPTTIERPTCSFLEKNRLCASLLRGALGDAPLLSEARLPGEGGDHHVSRCRGTDAFSHTCVGI